MIAGEKAFVVPLISVKKIPSPSERELISDSAAIMSDFPLAGSILEKTLHKYAGAYLNVQEWEQDRQMPPKLSTVITDIQKIRNTLSQIDPDNIGYYYDNAWTYIHLLQETYDKLKKRLDEYNKLPFIIVGSSMDDFIENFWLKKYVVWHFDNFDELNKEMSKTENLQKKQPFHILFTDIIPSPYTIKTLKNKWWITIYTLADISEDTSSWWYIRFIEKRINTFVEAYDTYD